MVLSKMDMKTLKNLISNGNHIAIFSGGEKIDFDDMNIINNGLVLLLKNGNIVRRTNLKEIKEVVK